MRYFALYHDRTRLHDVDVMDEKRVVELSQNIHSHLEEKKVVQVDFENLDNETINKSLDYLVDKKYVFKIEELVCTTNLI